MSFPGRYELSWQTREGRKGAARSLTFHDGPAAQAAARVVGGCPIPSI